MLDVLVILLFFMIVGALIAIETTNLLSSIICVGAVGFLLSIAFLLLGAPDIAITQVVVEILCLVILIRATISRDLTTISGDREFLGLIVTVVMVLSFSLFGLKMLDEFPPFGQSVIERCEDAPSRTYVTYEVVTDAGKQVNEGWALKESGSANIVTAILLDFRAYDTLGEATVLFCSILGALALLRRKARNRPDEESDSP